MNHAAVAISLALTGWLALLPRAAAAQEGVFGALQTFVETTVTSVASTTTTAAGTVTKSSTSAILPTLNVNLDTLIYPKLRLNAGGTFDVDLLSRDINGDVVDSTVTSSRPFFLLRSTNQLFSPGVGYFRREERVRVVGGSDVTVGNEEYAGYLGWNPDGGPRSEFQFLHTNTFDEARDFQDVSRNISTLVSNYNRGSIGAFYNGSHIATDDRLNDVTVSQSLHSARVTYGRSFIDDRLRWNASYNVNHQRFSSEVRRENGTIDVPLVAAAGLSSLSDTPVTSRLSPNPALIDGQLAVGAGINIGRPDPGTDARARNMGLDFLEKTAVNRLLVWVDRPLPPEIASAFSWEVYSSPDNILWKRERIVSSAPFGPFEYRFEIRFATVITRYIKVVTVPLSPAVPESSRFPTILVTELQAFVRRSTGETGRDFSQTTSLFSSDARYRILNVPSLYYEGFYFHNGTDFFGPGSDTLSNGLSFDQQFARIFSAHARAAREQSWRGDLSTTATITDATLSVEPVPTFRSTLLYTGRDERSGVLLGDRRSLICQNTAQLYDGVDVQLGFGWNFTTRETGETLRDRVFNVTTTMMPRSNLSLTLSYDDTTTQRSGSFEGDPESRARRAYVSVAYDPARTLHLVLTQEVLATTGESTRTMNNVGVSWTPFPDGNVQLTFAYSEFARNPEAGSDRSVAGGVRWNFSRRSYLDVSYQNVKSHDTFQTTESRILGMQVRVFL